MSNKYKTMRIGDRVWITDTTSLYPYSPTTKISAIVAKEYDVPTFNWLRRVLGYNEPEPHTTLVYGTSYISDGVSRSSRRDSSSGLSSEALDALKSNGYEIISFDEAFDRYDEDSDITDTLQKRITEEKRRIEREQERIEFLSTTRERIEAEHNEDMIEDCPNCNGFILYKENCERGDFLLFGDPVQTHCHEMNCKVNEIEV